MDRTGHNEACSLATSVKTIFVNHLIDFSQNLILFPRLHETSEVELVRITTTLHFSNDLFDVFRFLGGRPGLRLDDCERVPCQILIPPALKRIAQCWNQILVPFCDKSFVIR